MNNSAFKPAPWNFVPGRIRATCHLLFLFAALCIPSASHAADTYGTLVDKRFDPHATTRTNSVPDNSSGTPAANTAALEQALINRAQKVELGPPPPPPPNLSYALAITIASGVASLVLLKIYFILSRVDAKRKAAAEAREEEKLERIGKEPTVVSLFQELKHGLNPTEAQAVPEAHATVLSTEAKKDEEARLVELAVQVFELAPVLFSQFRKRFAEIQRTADITAKLKSLHEFSQEIRPSKAAARIPALRSHRLLAIALEGFLKQLSARATNLTPWRMQLATETLELLEDLYVPNLLPDLATKPLIRLLVVDDCAVSRRSMVFALKKVFCEPDLAENGARALDLAGKHAYDVIFLDIDMPGMDGFEVCERIRKTTLNRRTPIVFVTSHDNLESRAKLVTKGAQDLIGKPYLPAEITLKALQLSLYGRLKNPSAQVENASADISNVAAFQESSAAA
jgi:CheY-like chemotaxis protein